MLFSIYKSGQGYWTRTLTAVGVGTLVISGLAWILPHVEVQGHETLAKAIVGAVVVAFFAFAVWWVLNTPKIADFMIATEMEMKKVAWPTQQELITFTIVVIVGTLLMALLLWGVDLGFLYLFTKINIVRV
jgi:preprotein translocase subunit SecE